MRSLEGLDGILAALERVIADTPTHYEIVIWSDHGQSLGSTFEQLNGFTLGQRVDQLMDDATGGPGMVKAAYSSGKPALGVGAGNTPVVIDDTADVLLAVNSIIHSKTFDNGMICASEQSVTALDSVYDQVKA